MTRQAPAAAAAREAPGGSPPHNAGRECPSPARPAGNEPPPARRQRRLRLLPAGCAGGGGARAGMVAGGVGREGERGRGRLSEASRGCRHGGGTHVTATGTASRRPGPLPTATASCRHRPLGFPAGTAAPPPEARHCRRGGHVNKSVSL